MPLAKDAFWDRGTEATDSTLDPTKYHDPSEEYLPLSRTTLASKLPPSFKGAHGTIIKRSTLQGKPIGWDPYGVATRVNVDPDLRGQGFVVDFTKISKEDTVMAAEQAGVQQASTLEDLRFRAANAMYAFAVSDEPDQPSRQSFKQNRESPIALPGVYVVPEATVGGKQLAEQQQQEFEAPQGVSTVSQRPSQQRPKSPEIPGFAHDGPPVAIPKHKPAVIHAAGFQNPDPPAAKPANLFARVDKQPPAKPQTVVGLGMGGPPTFKVTFDVRESPVSIEAWYHQVIRNEQVLVVCYDTTSVGYPRTRLRPQDKDVAIHVEGSDVFYIVTDPGIVFQHDNEELQVFLIKSEHPFTTE